MRSLALLTLLSAVACRSTPALELPPVQLARVDVAQAMPLADLQWIRLGEDEARSEQCEAGRVPMEVASVVIAPGQSMRVGSTAVMELLGDGSIPMSARRGEIITPLWESLLLRAEVAKGFSARSCGPPSPSRLLLVLDERLPWETVAAVMSTARRASFDDLVLLVDAPEPWLDAPPPPPDRADSVDPPLGLTVHLEGGGARVVVGSSGSLVPCDPTPCADARAWDQAGLRAALAPLHAARPDEPVAQLSPSVGTPWAAVAATASAMAWTDAGEPLFSEVVLMDAVDATPIGPAVPDARAVLPRTWGAQATLPVLRLHLLRAGPATGRPEGGSGAARVPETAPRAR